MFKGTPLLGIVFTTLMLGQYIIYEHTHMYWEQDSSCIEEQQIRSIRQNNQRRVGHSHSGSTTSQQSSQVSSQVVSGSPTPTPTTSTSVTPPGITPDPTPVPMPEPSINPETTPNPEHTPEPTTAPGYIPEPTPYPMPSPGYSSEPTPSPMPTPEYFPEPTPDLMPTPEYSPEPTPSPMPTPEYSPEPTPDPMPTPEYSPEPTPTPDPTPDPIPLFDISRNGTYTLITYNGSLMLYESGTIFALTNEVPNFLRENDILQVSAGRIIFLNLQGMNVALVCEQGDIRAYQNNAIAIYNGTVEIWGAISINININGGIVHLFNLRGGSGHYIQVNDGTAFIIAGQASQPGDQYRWIGSSLTGNWVRQ